MEAATIIGLDLAKRSFQAHGALADGSVAFRKKLTREKVLGFLAEQPRCVVAMEACGSAHHWGRAIRDAGHEVRLIPPAYVKPFVKRQKNDAADAEAIAEAASRPTMRFVAVKTEEQQARAMLFRTRDLLVRQRTQLINALRGQLSEHGVVAPQGPANVAILAQAIDDMTPSLPLLVVELARVYLDQIDGLSEKVAGLEKAIACEAKRATQPVACRQCRALGRSRPWRSRPSRRQWRYFAGGAISQPGLGWSPCNTRPEASRFSGKLRNRGSAIFAGC